MDYIFKTTEEARNVLLDVKAHLYCYFKIFDVESAQILKEVKLNYTVFGQYRDLYSDSGKHFPHLHFKGIPEKSVKINCIFTDFIKILKEEGFQTNELFLFHYSEDVKLYKAINSITINEFNIVKEKPILEVDQYLRNPIGIYRSINGVVFHMVQFRQSIADFLKSVDTPDEEYRNHLINSKINHQVYLAEQTTISYPEFRF